MAEVPKPAVGGPPADVNALLETAGVPHRRMHVPADTVLFSQGDSATSVFYLQDGGVKLSVLSRRGKEAVIAMLGAGDFFGEGCLAGQALRMCTARSFADSTVLLIPKADMVRALHSQAALSDRFLAHMLTRNIRVEEDLVDQLFNSGEKRLARTLLLLAQYSTDDAHVVLPNVSQEMLAEMVGTTRSRVNIFMNKFRKLGYVEYDRGGVKIHRSLLNVVLLD